MKKITYLICFAGIVMQACNSEVKQDNPFLKDFDTPFGVPPFHLIQNKHYLPAFDEGMRQQNSEIEAILNNPEVPTFANTIEALEKSGQLLNKVSGVFINLQAANTSDSLQIVAETVTPLLTSHKDAINLNEKLFERVKTIYNNKENENLTTEQKQVLDKYYQGFIRGGANLSPEDKEKFKK